MFKKKIEHKLCMYVDSKCLNESIDIQRDIDLEDILLNHTKFYDDEEIALKDGYVPLNFATSVRTVFSNKVIGIDKKSITNYYINLGNIEMFPHKGLDLIMYLSSVSLFSIVNYKKGFDDLMLHSEFQCIGLFNPSSNVMNPIIYSHIYIDDNWEKDFERYLKDNSHWVDISKALDNPKGNLNALINTLLVVDKKEEEANESDNYS